MSDRERPSDLERAWELLQQDPCDGQAQELLSRHVHRQAREVFFQPQQAEEQAQELLLHLFTRLSTGTLVITGSLEGYIRRALRNRMVSALRARRPEDPLDPEKPEPAAPAQPRPPDERVDLVRLLERAYQRVWQQRRPQDRAKLEEAWLELGLRVEHDLNGPDLLARTKGLARDTPAMKKGLEALYKRDARLLDALLDALHAMDAEGLLDEAERDFVRRMQRILLSRQDPAT